MCALFKLLASERLVKMVENSELDPVFYSHLISTFDIWIKKRVYH